MAKQPTPVGGTAAAGVSRISPAEFEALANDALPMTRDMGCRVVAFGYGTASFRLPFRPSLLRPGGTIIGPALMALADLAMFGALLTMIGRVEMAVTSNLNINFLRRPGQRDLIAEARVLKLGKRLAFGEVTTFSDGEPEPVTHATLSYALPPDYRSKA